MNLGSDRDGVNAPGRGASYLEPPLTLLPGQQPPELGHRQSLNGLGLVRGPDGHGFTTRRDVNRRAFQELPVADGFDDDLTQIRPKARIRTSAHQAAAGIRAMRQWAQSLSMAETRASIISSVWFGEGVKRRRSVPLGTVG